MAKKIKLNKSHRIVIQDFGLNHIASSVDRTTEVEQLAIMVDGANTAIRKKYPEEDMAVLRNYNLARIDLCLKFQFPSGRVDEFYFNADDHVADLPYKAGCYHASGDVFPVSESFEKAFDEHAKLKAASDKFQQQRNAEFFGYLAACQFLDDVLDVITLPDDVRVRLGHSSTALVLNQA